MSSSKYADEGTIAHTLAAMCLEQGKDALACLGRVIESEDYEHSPLGPSSAARWMRCPGSTALITKIKFVPRKFSMAITEDMAAGVQIYLDKIRQYADGPGKTLLIEQKLDISEVIGVPQHYGTCDAVILDEPAEELQVHDLKFGKGVEVFALENEQMLTYAAAALRQYAPLMEAIRRVRMVIHQPRIHEAPDKWDVPVEDVLAFEARIQAAAVLSLSARALKGKALDPYLLPGDKQCKFCDAKATCPALAREVAKTVFDDFDVLPEHCDKPVAVENLNLGLVLPKLGMIESWCAAVAAHAEALLLRGDKVPGYKLVQGKRGNRKWTSDAEAEALLKAFRMKHDEMYDYSVISPTTAEKRLKEHPKQWVKALPLISQSEGKPSVAPESDKRPALIVKPAIEEFTELPNGN